MRRSISLIIATLICFSSLSVSASDVEAGFTPKVSGEITAQAVYLKNLDTGVVMYEKNADLQLAPASLAKIMTGILAIENTSDLDSEVVTYPVSVQDYLYEYSMEHGALSHGNLIAGEEMSMREYLYASLLPSANEAAMTIADHIAGSQEAFCDMMNQRAKELGATNTNFINATGLGEDDNYSSARDLAAMAEHALSLDAFPEIISASTYTAGATNLHDSLTWENTNDMQKPDHSYYYPGIVGVKTGTLPSIGRNFISTIKKDSYYYMLVIIGAEISEDADGNPIYSTNAAFEETKKIYDWVFSSFRTKTLVQEGETVGELPITLSSEANFVRLVTETHFSSLVPEEADVVGSNSQIHRQLVLKEQSLIAPIAKGEHLGDMIIILSGEELGRVKVVAASDVKASTLLTMVDRAKTISETFAFKFVTILVVVLIIVYIIILILKNRRRRREKRRQGKYKNRPPRY